MKFHWYPLKTVEVVRATTLIGFTADYGLHQNFLFCKIALTVCHLFQILDSKPVQYIILQNKSSEITAVLKINCLLKMFISQAE